MEDPTSKLKKIKIKHSPSKALSTTISIPAPRALPKLSITLKLGPRPVEPEPFPCCLCVSMSKEGLLRVHEPPLARKDAVEAAGNPKVWMAHEFCASIVPETWVDVLDTTAGREKVVFGVDGIVKDRWNLVRGLCLTRMHCDYSADTGAIEMLCMYQNQAQGTRRPGAVHEGQVLQSVPCGLRARWAQSGYCVLDCARRGKGGHCPWAVVADRWQCYGIGGTNGCRRCEYGFLCGGAHGNHPRCCSAYQSGTCSKDCEKIGRLDPVQSA